MNIKVGDRVRCYAPRTGISFEGKVTSAHNYGSDDNPDRYIELVEDDGKPAYIKQKQDSEILETTILVELVKD